MKFKCLWSIIFCVLLVVITLNLVYALQAHINTIRERIDSRNYPSIFAAWGGVFTPPLIDRHRFEGFNELQEMAIYDVHWNSYFIRWQSREDGEHVPIIATGHISVSRNWQRRMLHYNPNMLFLYAMTFSGIHDPQYMPAAARRASLIESLNFKTRLTTLEHTSTSSCSSTLATAKSH